MPAPRFQPDAVFEPAPAGTRVRLLTLLSAVIVVVVTIAILVQLLTARRPPPWLALLPIGIGPAVVAAIWLDARIRRYRLVGAAELQVGLGFRTMHFPLEGLKDVLSDREALQGARKIVGNIGLGSINGRFRSKHLGPFRAYVTDAEHAVVLRWPDRCLVISPQQHSLLVEAVRKRAGLSR